MTALELINLLQKVENKKSRVLFKTDEDYPFHYDIRGLVEKNINEDNLDLDRGNHKPCIVLTEAKPIIDKETNSCGNPNHPNGAWHEATPYPITLFDRIIYWWRNKKYGCSCEVKDE